MSSPETAGNRGSAAPVQDVLTGMRLGIVGLGHMGHAFAANLIADGASLTVYDRKAEVAAPLAARGAAVAKNLDDFAGCQIVLSSLPDDDVVRHVALGAEGLAKVLGQGAIHVSMSTISERLSRELAQAHRARKQGFVAAPVLGNPDLAATRQLFVLAGGAPPDILSCLPVLERLGQRVFTVAEDPGLANLMKLAGNALTAATLQSMGEVFALLAKAGLPPERAQEILTGSLFDGRVHKTYGGKIVTHQYSPPGMTVPLAVKDLRLTLAAAEHEAVPMPVASLVHDMLVAAEARGWADLDWSVLGRLSAANAGLFWHTDGSV
jgi:3-hydroxyisobutyrate dehydrogenase-like beta-hydroxyacid dehydrogenase